MASELFKRRSHPCLGNIQNETSAYKKHTLHQYIHHTSSESTHSALYNLLRRQIFTDKLLLFNLWKELLLYIEILASIYIQAWQMRSDSQYKEKLRDRKTMLKFLCLLLHIISQHPYRDRLSLLYSFCSSRARYHPVI